MGTKLVPAAAAAAAAAASGTDVQPPPHQASAMVVEPVASSPAPVCAAAPTSAAPADAGSAKTEAAAPPTEVKTEAAAPPTEVKTKAAAPPTEVKTEAAAPPTEVKTEAAAPPTEVKIEAAAPPTEVKIEAAALPTEVSPGEAGGAALNSAADAASASADASATAPSKRSLKRAARLAARYEANAERKRARREAERAVTAARSAARNARRDAELAAMEPEAREALLLEQRERALALRTAERAEKERVKEVVRSGGKFRVCIDLGWNAEMSEKELRSLAKQIAYSYSAVRKAVEDGRDPLRLSVTGLDARVEEVMSKHTSGWEDWPILMTKKTLVETHQKADVVYLTHDAEEVLSELHPDKVYVIGGIVDRNRLKGATLEKANGLDLKTAKLNLDTSVHIGTGTPVLTVNHCVDILLRASQGVSWQEAYMAVLPPRKTLRAVGDGNSADGPKSTVLQPTEAAVDDDVNALGSNGDVGSSAPAATAVGDNDVTAVD